MKDVLPLLLSFPPDEQVSDVEYDQRIRNSYLSLTQIAPSKFNDHSPNGDAILEQLDPSVNSLSYLITLLAAYDLQRAKTQEAWPTTLRPGSAIWSKSLTFLKTFDSVQVRYAGQEWRKLVELVISSAEAVSTPFLAIEPVRDAILCLDPAGSTFTSTHVIFTRLCLQARAFDAALPVLDKDICHFPSNSDKMFLKRSQKLPCAEHESSMTYITTSSNLPAKLTYKDHLEYFLYGGMIYLGLKKWEKALHFLEVAIAAPSSGAVSQIMIEAYKKWVLASLLDRGTTSPIPKPTSSHAAKTYKAVAKPYDALAEVFKTGNLNRLMAEIEVGQSIWLGDNNTGLVLQVLGAFRKFSVLKLERTFTALSIPDVIARAELNDKTVEETEAFVASLIASGELKGTLLQPDDPSQPKILRFSTPTSDTSSETQIRDDLEAQKQRLTKLLSHIQASDNKLELGREYVEHMRRDKKRKMTAGKEGAVASATVGIGGGGEFDFDEDMMGDLQ
ncbi:hypothetical protein FQN54_000961 [Arachnomyces sp. PD_36]|nr:hypothetical protein FQN54_000961 [Arachnomyces sp. PD_36]